MFSSGPSFKLDRLKIELDRLYMGYMWWVRILMQNPLLDPGGVRLPEMDCGEEKHKECTLTWRKPRCHPPITHNIALMHSVKCVLANFIIACMLSLCDTPSCEPVLMFSKDCKVTCNYFHISPVQIHLIAFLNFPWFSLFCTKCNNCYFIPHKIKASFVTVPLNNPQLHPNSFIIRKSIRRGATALCLWLLQHAREHTRIIALDIGFPLYSSQ